MDRRAFLAAVAASGLAGCLGGAGTETASPSDADEHSSRTPTGTPTPEDVPLARRGQPGDICSQPFEGVGPDIRAIVAARFAADWSGVDPEPYDPLTDDSMVVGLARDGAARAYPLTVLWKHEVVNDDFGGPVMVTFCSLCTSGMVARRTVDGEPTRFGVTGLLWTPPSAPANESKAADRVFPADIAEGWDDPEVQTDRNLVMYDVATGSYWSQLLARAICGPRRGEFLEVLPATVASWSEWRAAHPGTDVLLPPPHSVARNPPAPEG